MDTIFFCLTLQRSISPLNVFRKMQKSIKKRGPSQNWVCTIDEENEIFSIDFHDNKSEPFVLRFNEKNIAEGSCRVAFPLEGELFDDNKKSEFKALINTIYVAQNSYSRIEISDESNLAENYFTSLVYDIYLRSLTECEKARLDRLYNCGYDFYEDFIIALFAEDWGLPDTFSMIDVIAPSSDFFNERPHQPLIQAFAESYLAGTSAMRPSNLGYGELSEKKLSFHAFSCGVSYLFLNDGGTRIICGSENTFGQRHIQIAKYFKEKFFPMFAKLTDPYEKCELAYRYILSIYDYCGLRFTGKDQSEIKHRMPNVLSIKNIESLSLKELNSQEQKDVEYNSLNYKFPSALIWSYISLALCQMPNADSDPKNYINSQVLSKDNVINALRAWVKDERIEYITSAQTGTAQKDADFDTYVQVLESFIFKIARYKGKKLSEMTKNEYLSDEVSHAVGGFVLGALNFMYNFNSVEYLSEAFKKQYPQIELLYKDLFLPQYLLNFPNLKSFVLTHRFIASLFEYSGFEV